MVEGSIIVESEKSRYIVSLDDSQQTTSGQYEVDKFPVRSGCRWDVAVSDFCLEYWRLY
jgi:hypothetical protein